jgi:hypothetical protein
MTTARLKPREQGDLGELSAMEWLASQGARIYIPVFHSPDIDLIAELGNRLLRVQVKTCTYQRDDRWCVQVATCGGNQSWNGTVKRLDPSRYDLLFVLVGDGRRWCIPAHAVEGTTSMLLGGPKYSEFEVESAQPIAQRAGSRIGDRSLGERRRGRVGRDCKSRASALSGFESHLPHQPELPSGPSARTRVSGNHQITIPMGPFRGAGLEVGQAVRVTATDHGHLLLDRIELPPDALETDDAAQP